MIKTSHHPATDRACPASTVHLVVSDLYPGDAIGNFVLAVHETLREQHIPAQLYAERFGDSLAGVRPYAAFFETVLPDDILFYQLSNHDPALPELMAAPCRKVIYYHNITPGHFFGPYAPEIEELLDTGRAALPLAGAADALLANSRYSLNEITPFLQAETPRMAFPPFLASRLPFCFDKQHKQKAPLPACVPDTPYLLALGRVVPHKRLEDAVSVFSHIHKQMPDMRLVIAGGLYWPYAEPLQRSAAELTGNDGSVVFTDRLEQHEVAALLNNASGLLHSSAHEGFCMPVLEAMLAGIPVFAHQQEAVAETLGGAGTLFDAASPEQAAQAIVRVLLDPPTKAAIVAQQKKQAQYIYGCASGEVLLRFIFGSQQQ